MSKKDWRRRISNWLCKKVKEPPRETVSSTASETLETVGGQLSKSSSADSAVEATEELVGETVDEVGKTVGEVGETVELVGKTVGEEKTSCDKARLGEEESLSSFPEIPTHWVEWALEQSQALQLG